jgi:hypothetical protein
MYLKSLGQITNYLGNLEAFTLVSNIRGNSLGNSLCNSLYNSYLSIWLSKLIDRYKVNQGSTIYLIQKLRKLGNILFLN